MKTKKILVEMPVDWEEQLSTVNYAWIGKKLYEILRRSPVVEPCEDAISREDALMCMTGEYPADQKYEPEDIISKHIKRIKALPSVTPKQMVGRWIDEGIYADGSNASAYRCSVCGEHIIEYEPDRYCKFCGAKMIWVTGK